MTTVCYAFLKEEDIFFNDRVFLLIIIYFGTMFFNLIYIVLIVELTLCQFVYEEENFDSCVFQNGTIGVCLSIGRCRAAYLEYKYFHIQPTTCGFCKNDPILCCKHYQAESEELEQIEPLVQLELVNTRKSIERDNIHIYNLCNT